VTIEHVHPLIEQASRLKLASELELLATIGQDFAASAELGETLANAIGQIMAYMETEAASIFLLDAAGEKLVCQACAGPVEINGLTIGAGQGIIGRTVQDNALQMVLDVSADGGFSGAVDAQTGFVTRSILCAPLQMKGQMLGALEVINKRTVDGLFAEADGHLLMALAGLVSLAVHNARMAEALVEQERMRRELDLAREIQRGLLPAPHAGDFPVCGLNLPALEVSGDFFDYFSLPDGRIAWGLGDVSGKGMNAAMLMAKTISLFRCLGKQERDPAKLLAVLNDEVAETARFGMFVTMVAGLYDPASGEVIFANAGHQPPLLRAADGGYGEFEEAGPPLGIITGMTYDCVRLHLAGGRLFVFTDGVTEGRAENGDMLGLDGLRALLDAHVGGAAVAQLAAVAEALQQPGQRLHDDLTLLAIG
jgi:sigma-B regulation protein RsbU (phosphoserine phosphatase)